MTAMTAVLTILTSLPNQATMLLMFEIINPKTTKYSYWYHIKLDAQPPAGLVHLHVATY